MRTLDRRRTAAAIGMACMVCAGHAQSPGPSAAPLGIGRAATPAQVRAWDIDIAPDGVGLPEGAGTVSRGREVYVTQCAACHGAKGEGGLGDRLAGGQGTLTAATPVKTVGSFWPYATTLFDYVRRAMPLTAPQSLCDADVYAVSAYVLYLNGIVDEAAVMDARSLPRVRMPNRDGFESDPRPDVKSPTCMKDCTR